MKQIENKHNCQEENGHCDCLPNPVRMNYFYGQLLSDRDLRTDQNYFRNKLKHANRCLHGYGVLCGMTVTAAEPPKECLPSDSTRRKKLRVEIRKLDVVLAKLKVAIEKAESDEEREKLQAEFDQSAAQREALLAELEKLNKDRPDRQEDCDDSPPLHRVRVTCGAAIDCNGEDVILHTDRSVNLWPLLKPSEHESLDDGQSAVVYLSICYEECGSEPTQPVALDDCATTSQCQMAKIAESAQLIASLEKPEEDSRCEPCCMCCDEACLLLATVELSKEEPVAQEDIDNGARRRFGLYESTVITGVSWINGATYSRDTANEMLGWRDETGGIEIEFSRPIHVSSIVPGTVEILRVTGGGGLSGVYAAMEGEFVDLPENGMVNRIRYRNTSRESVQEKDRVMVIVRAPFLLDACCRPVAGLHIGGRVPRLMLETNADTAARKEEERAGLPNLDHCIHPPQGPMAWTSNGDGNFESWFWIDGEQ